MKASEFIKRFNELVEVCGGDPEIIIDEKGDGVYYSANLETQNVTRIGRAYSFESKDGKNEMTAIKIW